MIQKEKYNVPPLYTFMTGVTNEDLENFNPTTIEIILFWILFLLAILFGVFA